MISSIKEDVINKTNNNLQKIIIQLYLTLNHKDYCQCDYCQVYKELPRVNASICAFEEKIERDTISDDDDDYARMGIWSCVHMIESCKEQKRKLENIKLKF